MSDDVVAETERRVSLASIHDEFPITYGFEQQARNICIQAETRGETVHGISPWYCAARLIEHGARVAFIGANPGGGAMSKEDDERVGRLRRPYEASQYNAWLDDMHWEGGGASHQQRVIDTFKLLFGSSQGEYVLREAACLNVVPVRSVRTSELSRRTWSEGVEGVTQVLMHVAPGIIVCNGNGGGQVAMERSRQRRVQRYRGRTEGCLWHIQTQARQDGRFQSQWCDSNRSTSPW